MSYDGYVRSLRDGLVEGGRRRRRHERRRTVALAVTPLVLVVALVGGLVVRAEEDATDVRTDVGSTPEVATTTTIGGTLTPSAIAS